MGRFLFSALLVAVLGAGGVYAQWRFRPCDAPLLPLEKWGAPPRPACNAPLAKAEAAAPREVEPPAVTVTKAETRRFTDRLFVSGTLVAREEIMVAPRIADLTVVEIDAEDGDRVEKGQVLAKLDRSQLDAALSQNDAALARADANIDQAKSMIAQSESTLEFASNDYDRAKKLGAGIMAAATVEQRETTMKTATAALAAAKNALSVAEADRLAREADRKELMVRIGRTEVRAPVSGVVSRRSARLGSTAATSGEPLYRIVKDGAVDLYAEVPEQWIPRLEVDMPATLRLPGLDQPVAGKVRLVNQEVDKASRTGNARIALSDPSHAHLGAFASGEVDLTTRDGVAAPTTAVKRDGDAGTVLVVNDGKVEERKVTLGIVEDDDVEILSGVAAGETLVARASSFLRPGDKVRAMPMIVGAGG